MEGAPAPLTLDGLQAVELRVGRILEARAVDNSDRLIHLTVDFGEETPRQVVSGIARSFLPASLVGCAYLFVTNLAPRTIMGLESQAMILATEGEHGLALLTPTRTVPPGAQLR